MGKRNLGGFEKFQSVYSESKSIYRVYNQNHDSLNKWFAADMAFDHHHMLHGKTLILRKEILKVTPILHKGQEISEAIFLSFNCFRKPKKKWHSFCIMMCIYFKFLNFALFRDWESDNFVLVLWKNWSQDEIFSNFSCMFLNPNNFFQFEL